MGGMGAGDPFVTNLEDDPAILEGEPSSEDTPLDADRSPLETGGTEEPQEATAEPEEPEATHEPIVDDAVSAKLARLDRLERDAEIAQIIQRREEEALQAQAEQARAEAEQKQIDDHFAAQRKQIVTLFGADKMSADEFVQAMDNLAAARIEVSQRQMAARVQTYVDSAIDGRLNRISSGYKERQAFQRYAPELVEALPAVADAIERMRMAGIPQEEISLLVEGARRAYKVPTQKASTVEAQQAARRAGAVERPTRAARNTRASEIEEDKKMRGLAREFFS